MRRQSVTLKDVAKAAKVSLSTASGAINNKLAVAAGTRQKVLNAAKKLGYRASFVPKSLRSKSSKAIGFIFPDIVNPFFSALVNAIEDTALKEGYVVILGSTKHDIGRELRYLNIFAERWIDGIIWAESSNEDGKNIQYIQEQDIPIVFIDREIEQHFTNLIGIDDEMAMFEATKYLIDLGHKKIAFISGPLNIGVFTKRLRGYQRALKTHNLQFKEKLVEEGDETALGGGIAVRKLLKKNEDITAILASNDIMAIGGLKELNEANLRVPQDISLMGFDNIPLTLMVTPSLTTVSQPCYEMGVEAVKLLLEIIQGKKTAKSKIILGTEIIMRESTSPPGKAY